mmetsp:Transcript_52176/g.131081  ORF Transcript_52176/g.131081 Transcript_52176/m.131081 type:complete len:275 (-) Transcript_52176:337-1161(-)
MQEAVQHTQSARHTYQASMTGRHLATSTLLCAAKPVPPGMRGMMSLEVISSLSGTKPFRPNTYLSKYSMRTTWPVCLITAAFWWLMAFLDTAQSQCVLFLSPLGRSSAAWPSSGASLVPAAGPCSYSGLMRVSSFNLSGFLEMGQSRCFLGSLTGLPSADGVFSTIQKFLLLASSFRSSTNSCLWGARGSTLRLLACVGAAVGAAFLLVLYAVDADMSSSACRNCSSSICLASHSARTLLSCSLLVDRSQRALSLCRSFFCCPRLRMMHSWQYT